LKIWREEAKIREIVSRNMIAPGNMLLYARKNNTGQNMKVRLWDEPYLLINIFFAGVILLIFAYSGFFSPEKGNYPVVCLHEKVTGQPCVSCGLSHSFSLIIRGRVEEAYHWNRFGMRIFIFFVAQLVLRVAFSIFYLKYSETRKPLIIVDCFGSGIIFFVAFWPFIASIGKGILFNI
jgi:hypothetical protein